MCLFVHCTWHSSKHFVWIISFEPFHDIRDSGEEVSSKEPVKAFFVEWCPSLWRSATSWVLSRLQSSDSDYQSFRGSSNCQTRTFTSFYSAASSSQQTTDSNNAPVQTQNLLSFLFQSSTGGIQHSLYPKL